MGMIEPGPPDPYDDVNEAVVAEWKAETTPAERVKSTIRRAYEPVSAEAVGDSARTTTKTARKHLEALADDGFVTTTPGDYGATLYRRSSESLITEQANRLLSDHSAEELASRIADMRAEIQEYRATYGVDSPEELAVRLGTETLDGRDPLGGTESTDGTDPTDGTEPLDETETTDGTDPTDGTEPLDGTETTDGIDPTDGTEPLDGTETTDGTEIGEETETTGRTDADTRVDESVVTAWQTTRRNLAFATAAVAIARASEHVTGARSPPSRAVDPQ